MNAVQGKRLAGKVIVIIGGTSGLGLAATRVCLDEGARVLAVGWNQEVAPGSAESPGDAESAGAAPAHAIAVAEGLPIGENLHILSADARNPVTAPEAILEAERRWGTLDGLYHVAGGSGRRFGDGPLHEVTDAGWSETLDWNLHSLFYSYRAACQYWLRQGRGGTLLGLSSVLATRPAPRHFATIAYAAAKGAIQSLTTSIASYYAAFDIRVNAIAPGLCDTPMARRAVGDPQVRHYVECRQALGGGRPGEAADLDGAVVYFLSDESRFVTGQVLAVDGGWSVADLPPENTS